jgi:hypothetical protein
LNENNDAEFAVIEPESAEAELIATASTKSRGTKFTSGLED